MAIAAVRRRLDLGVFTGSLAAELTFEVSEKLLESFLTTLDELERILLVAPNTHTRMISGAGIDTTAL